MRTSLNVPDETLDAFDAVWQSQGISSRSRAVREAMQEYIESHQDLDEMAGTVAAVIVFDYSYDAVVQDIHEIQHAYEHLVNSSSHVHHGNWCLETVHCTGDPDGIRELVYRLRDFDAVNRVKLMVVDGADSGGSIAEHESAHDH